MKTRNEIEKLKSELVQKQSQYESTKIYEEEVMKLQKFLKGYSKQLKSKDLRIKELESKRLTKERLVLIKEIKDEREQLKNECEEYKNKLMAAESDAVKLRKEVKE